jgi:hypothetical protein
MNVTVKVIVSVAMLALANGCSSYSTEDYGDPMATRSDSLCANMEPAQELKCKEREESLIIGLGADKNCNHPYEYEKNRCNSEKAKQKQALDESLKKHTDKLAR